MNNLRHILLSAAFCTLAITAANAQDLESLNRPANARSMSMGGTDMASGAYGTTIMVNPAAMALADETFSIQGNYMGISPSSKLQNHFNLAAFYSFDRFAVSVYGQGSLGTSRMESDLSGNALGFFTPYDYTVGAGFAAEIVDGLAIGLNAKMINSTRMSGRWLATAPDYKNAYAFAADFSIMYTVQGFRVAAGIDNIGTKVKYSNREGYEGSDLPTAVRLGLGYGKEWEKHSLDASVQADYLIFHSEICAGAGVEYGFNDMLFVRGGYHFSHAALNSLPQYASVGLGVKFFGITVDAAYMMPFGTGSVVGALKDTFIVSLGWAF